MSKHFSAPVVCLKTKYCMKQTYTSTLKLMLTLLAGLFTSQAFAAKNMHVFKKTTGTYVELTGATPVTSAVMAYDSFLVASLAGETFKLFGASRTMLNYSIMIMKDGRIQFSEDTAFGI